MRLGQFGAQISVLALGQQEVGMAVRLCRVTPVAHAIGAVAVVAADDVADPMGRIGGHGGRHYAARQQPEEVP